MTTVMLVVALGAAVLAHVRCAELAARAAKAEHDLASAAEVLIILGAEHGWSPQEMDARASESWRRRLAAHQATCDVCRNGEGH